MALERSDVEKIAHLARLGLNDADIPQTTATLNNILGLIDAMQAVEPGLQKIAVTRNQFDAAFRDQMGDPDRIPIHRLIGADIAIKAPAQIGMARVSEGWVTLHSSAARVKLRNSTSARKSSSQRMSMRSSRGGTRSCREGPG